MGKRLLILAGVIVSALAQTPTAEATSISFDLDAFDAPGSETQAGFTRMTDALILGNSFNNTTIQPTATASGVTVTASQLGGFRDRGVGSAAISSNDFPQVLRDSVFSGTNGVINITISGLNAGLHSVTSFHYDPQVSLDDTTFDIFVDDALGTGQLKINDASFVLFNQSNATHGRYTYNVTSDGINDIVITTSPDGGGGRTRFNGISIVSAVPEPSTLLLLSMGLAGLVVSRKRNS